MRVVAPSWRSAQGSASSCFQRPSTSGFGAVSRRHFSASGLKAQQGVSTSISRSGRQSRNKRFSSTEAIARASSPSWIYLGAGVGVVTLATLLLQPKTATEAPAAVVEEKPKRIVTGEELAKHTTKESLWVVVDGQVWDVTDVRIS